MVSLAPVLVSLAPAERTPSRFMPPPGAAVCGAVSVWLVVKKRASFMVFYFPHSKATAARQGQRHLLSRTAGRLHCPRQTTNDGVSWVLNDHRPMDDPTTRGRCDFATLNHERTASTHCAETRENTECATRAARATAANAPRRGVRAVAKVVDRACVSHRSTGARSHLSSRGRPRYGALRVAQNPRARAARP